MGYKYFTDELKEKIEQNKAWIIKKDLICSDGVYQAGTLVKITEILSGTGPDKCTLYLGELNQANRRPVYRYVTMKIDSFDTYFLTDVEVESLARKFEELDYRRNLLFKDMLIFCSLAIVSGVCFMVFTYNQPKFSLATIVFLVGDLILIVMIFRYLRYGMVQRALMKKINTILQGATNSTQRQN